jgi:uncharacterized protein
MKLKLKVLPKKYSICRLSPHAAIPGWLASAEFFSVTRTADELSIVSLQELAEEVDTACSRDWRIMKIEGPLDLTIVGLIAGVAGVFKDAGVPIFTMSTYDTDYIMVKEQDLGAGVRALEGAGHEVEGNR